MTRVRYLAVAMVAFVVGTASGAALGSTALAPITLQPGQQITIIAATPMQSLVPPATGVPAPTVTPAPTATQPPATPTPTLTPTPTGDPNAMPTASLPGWDIAFGDDFDIWQPSGYFVYPSSWHDTTGHGTYTPSIISARGGNLNIAIHTVDGVHEVAAIIPLLLGTDSRGNVSGGLRYSFRIRADAMPGYKGVPLLWPKGAVWPANGEIDGPESDFTAQPAAFVHHQGATSGSDQDYYLTPSGTSWQAWHTYTVEWLPGVRVDMWIDGVQWVHDTTRIPSGPMHLVMQFETSTSGSMPAASVSGLVQIAWLALWTVAS